VAKKALVMGLSLLRPDCSSNSAACGLFRHYSRTA
jgi:hypothetical protein